jgi:hypothetical protein
MRPLDSRCNRAIQGVAVGDLERFSHVLHMSYVNEGEDKEEEPALSFDDALRRFFLPGLYHLEHEVLGEADYDRDGKPDLPPDVAGGNH